jgi:hypothetical protein
MTSNPTDADEIPASIESNIMIIIVAASASVVVAALGAGIVVVIICLRRQKSNQEAQKRDRVSAIGMHSQIAKRIVVHIK